MLSLVHLLLALVNGLWRGEFQRKSGSLFAAIMLIVAFLLLPAIFVLGTFLRTGLITIATNATAYEQTYASDAARRYGRGTLNNAKETLGSAVWLWWVPCATPDRVHDLIQYETI